MPELTAEIHLTEVLVVRSSTAGSVKSQESRLIH